MCSARPCHGRRDALGISRNCTTNARRTDKMAFVEAFVERSTMRSRGYCAPRSGAPWRHRMSARGGKEDARRWKPVEFCREAVELSEADADAPSGFSRDA